MILNSLMERRRKARRNEAVVAALYDVVVARSREPVFFTDLGIPDTVSGRFEMVVLHAYFAISRLRGEGEAGKELAQALFDFMFVEMDSALREMGVGDLSVGKRIQKMASIFYGRGAAYDEALAASGDEALQEAVARNLFPDGAPSDAVLACFADYMRSVVSGLAGQPGEALMAGHMEFAPVPSLSERAVS